LTPPAGASWDTVTPGGVDRILRAQAAALETARKWAISNELRIGELERQLTELRTGVWRANDTAQRHELRLRSVEEEVHRPAERVLEDGHARGRSR
jgi:hypothetical protein